MNLPAILPCCFNRLHCSPSITPPTHFLRFVIRKKGSVVCRLSDNNKDDDSVQDNNSHQDNDQPLENTSLENNDGPQPDQQTGLEDGTDVQVASGSPLPGVKVPQQLNESIRIPKETVEILRNQVFSFDTFFVTSQEPYEGGVLFNGNLRGQAAKTYEKVSKRMQEKLGDDYKLFLLINPEDDKPVAVVVPRMTLQPETTAVPEWFAAGAFGLVTVFTLLLRNVPALQSNLFFRQS
uniref:Metalloendopeptidase n=1 Tax=Solanum tuberosum TaxID=4113 RepID=M1CPT2_SOLTU